MPVRDMLPAPGERPDPVRESEFRSIVRNFAPRIYRYALRVLGDPEEASEALQEILLNVYLSLPGFRRESAPATWVYRIALHTLVGYPRCDRTSEIPLIEPEEAELIIDESGDPEEMYRRKESEELLARCMAKLSPRESRAITLFYMDGLGYKQIASIMETSPGAVGLLLHRGKERLHVLLGGRLSLPL